MQIGLPQLTATKCAKQHRTRMKNGFKEKLIFFLAWISRRVHFRGMDRILYFLYHPEKRRADYVATVADYGEGLKININTSSFIEWMIFFHGTYEPQIRTLLHKLVEPGAIFLDVGANIGVHVLPASLYAGLGGRVIAFEPQPEILEKLKANVALNGLGNVEIEEYALSDSPGEMELFSFGERGANEGISSLYREHSGNLTRKFLVKVARLDEVVAQKKLPRIDFIKIDTEGNDFRVILGGERSISTFRPYVLFEFDESSWALAGSGADKLGSFWDKHKYRLYSIEEKRFLSGNKMSLNFCNVLAVPEEKTKRILS